jgi:hypothetical protein
MTKLNLRYKGSPADIEMKVKPVSPPSPSRGRRGRPVGSYSFVKLPMRDLARYTGPDTFVSVSRLWCEEVGLVVGICAPSVAIRKTRVSR